LREAGLVVARIDLPPGDEPEATRALALRPSFQAAVDQFERAVWRSSLNRRLHELVRMRVATINQCTVCMSWRNPTWCDDERLLAGVEHHRDIDGYTDAERVALEYTERFCTDSAGIDDALIDRLKQHFDSSEIVDVTLVVGKYMALGRFMQVLGLDQACVLHFDDAGVLSFGAAGSPPPRST
jgi:alkylhydroperoxidase family enzyme